MQFLDSIAATIVAFSAVVALGWRLIDRMLMVTKLRAENNILRQQNKELIELLKR